LETSCCRNRGANRSRHPRSRYDCALGGDEFAIIQRILYGPRDAARLAERLIASVSQSYTIDGNEIEIGASVGISLAPDDSGRQRRN